MDLIGTLQEIERRANRARRDIATGREAGLEINGTTALRDIEIAARDLLADLTEKKGGRPKPPAPASTPSSRAKRSITHG